MTTSTSEYEIRIRITLLAGQIDVEESKQWFTDDKVRDDFRKAIDGSLNYKTRPMKGGRFQPHVEFKIGTVEISAVD